MQDYHGEKLRCTDRGCIQVGAAWVYFDSPAHKWTHRIDLDLIYPPHLVLLPQCGQPLSSIGSETRLTTLWSSLYPLQPSSPSHPLGLPFEHPVTIPSDHFYPRPPILRQCPITSYLALSSDALTRMASAP